MLRIRCSIATVELLFGKEGKTYSDLLVTILEDHLANIDLENLRTTSDMIDQLAEALWELKLSPVKGWSPRCHIKLYVLHEMIDIIDAYREKNSNYAATQLRMYLKDMYTKMSETKWGD